MVAIVPQKGASLDLQALYDYVESALPSYARPRFLRLMEEMELTGTYKLKKTDLVKSGFAPDGNGEVYIGEPSRKAYVPITREHMNSLLAGQSKL